MIANGELRLCFGSIVSAGLEGVYILPLVAPFNLQEDNLGSMQSAMPACVVLSYFSEFDFVEIVFVSSLLGDFLAPVFMNQADQSMILG